MRKVILIGVSLIIALMGYLWWNYTNSGEDEIHLLPDNYKGIVTIIFNSSEGKAPQYEHGARVYEIPSNGILKTQFTFNKGWHNPPEFYYVRNGQRAAINDSQNVKIYSIQTGTTNISGDQKTEVNFMSYIICNPNEVDSLYAKREQMSSASL
jgi:hypothetical protein